jgi:hypothetical protein
MVAAVVAALTARYFLPNLGGIAAVHGPRPMLSYTNGVLKELHGPSLFPLSSEQSATVVLESGASVSASISPACLNEVAVGQSVLVDVLTWKGLGLKVYLVAGPNPHSKAPRPDGPTHGAMQPVTAFAERLTST